MAKKNKEVPSLIKALDFIALAQRDKGAPYQTHVLMRNNTAIAYDGVLAAGHMIDEDINACPHTMTLVAALKKCGQTLSVTQLDNGKLSIKSGKFKAFVPCSTDAVIQNTAPDPVAGYMTNIIRDGLLMVSPLIAENSQRVVMASAYLRSNSILATNGHVILEYWHGIDLPPGLIVPKLFINALAKIKKDIVQFGFSASSLTIYFDDNSWLKTQLYNENWPDCDKILNVQTNPTPVPEDFFDAFSAVSTFVEDGRIRIKPGKLQTHDVDGIGASYEVEGLSSDVVLNAKHINMLKDYAKLFDFTGVNGISYFYGDNVRGAIAQIRT